MEGWNNEIKEDKVLELLHEVIASYVYHVYRCTNELVVKKNNVIFCSQRHCG